MKNIEIIKNELAARKEARSAWGRGLTAYAFMILDEITERAEYEGREPETLKELEEWGLNGAENWKAASYGGNYLIYNYDIARTLCTPTELKKTNEGMKEPNSRETWCDVQARALYQAFNIIKDLAREEMEG